MNIRSLLRRACLPALLVAFSRELSAQPGIWTPARVVARPAYSGLQIAPDGTFAIYRKVVEDGKADRFRGHVHGVWPATGEHRQLTRGPEGEGEPLLSPGGGRLAFLAKRPSPSLTGDAAEKPQVWVLPLGGGEAFPATASEAGIEEFVWLDEKTLAVAARERYGPAERRDREAKDETLVVEDPALFLESAASIFTVALSPEEPAPMERVAGGRGPLRLLPPSPDGAFLLFREDRSPHFEADGRTPPRLFLRRRATGEERELFAGRRTKPEEFVWQRDSALLFAALLHSEVDGEDMAGAIFPWAVDPGSGAAEPIPLEWERGLAASSFQGLANGFLAFLADGTRSRPVLVAREDGAWRPVRIEGESAGRLVALTASPDSGVLIAETGAADELHRWHLARLDGSTLVLEREIGSPMDAFDDLPLARREIIRFEGAGGAEIEGILYHPHQEPAGRAPLVVMIHGGPFHLDKDQFDERWAYAPNLYCQRGAYCLKVNYHGSSEYGREFAESIKGRYYELEVADIFAGIAHLEERGLVDPDRLALAGWSNGAILAIACLTHGERFGGGRSYRFRACVPGAGDVNWTSDYGNCEFGPRFNDYYLGGSPWTRLQAYLDKSPLFQVEKVATPTLIFFGDLDRAVPAEQGWQWFRALQLEGRAPVRFVQFPGQQHGLTKPSFQRRKLSEEAAWMDAHLFGRPPEPLQPMAEDGPLANALAARGYARSGDAFGIPAGGVLVPEVVPAAGLLAGRFEVTRAQWRSVFPDAPLPAGGDNLPVTGVAAGDALRYAERLSALTGRTFRLPTEEEFDKLSAGSLENTLDFWSGVRVSLREAAALRSLAASLPGIDGAPPLVLPVGSRPPGLHETGGEPARIHDAGGNVSEWVVDSGGNPVLRGASALSLDDGSGEPSGEFPAYAGLRVVEVPPVR